MYSEFECMLVCIFILLVSGYVLLFPVAFAFDFAFTFNFIFTFTFTFTFIIIF